MPYVCAYYLICAIVVSCSCSAVGNAQYCGLVRMLMRAANNLYLMFSLCCTMRYIATGDVLKFFIIIL